MPKKAKKLKKGAPLVSLHDLFIVKLCELYDIETTLTITLPKMVKKAESEDLQLLLEEHALETENQVARLEEMFEKLGEPVKSRKSVALRGMVADAESTLKLKGEPTVLDAGIIANSQAIEHLEIACYGTALSWAEMMEHTDVAELLRETLNEEKMADEKLSALALEVINVEAMEEDTEDEEEDEEE